MNKKRFLGVFLSLLLMLSFPLSVSANSNYETNSESNLSVIVSDENGDDIAYELEEGDTIKIPIYSVEEGQAARAYQDTAVLTLTYSGGFATFLFTPINAFYNALTLGFTGDFISYHTSGERYGYNSYYLPVMTGTITAPARGQIRISGTYKILGYQDSNVLKSWPYGG